MTLDLDAVRARVAALRADDKAMTRGEWSASGYGSIHVDGQQAGISSMGKRVDADAIARTRNSLASTADMLESLLRAVDAAATIEAASQRTISSGDEALRTLRSQWASEREALRAEVASLTAGRDAMRPVVEAADRWRDDNCKGLGSHREAALADAIDAYRARKP